MASLDRRAIVAGIAAALAEAAASPLMAQTPAQVTPPPQVTPPAQVPGEPQAHFGFEDVLKRARAIGTAPFEANPPPLPDALARLDFDSWRDIRFRRDKALLGTEGGPFRMEMFHLGHIYPRPVTVNVVREGIATPVPYAATLFDYGRNRIEKPLPLNLGFAGFRLLYPLNRPEVLDEVAAFLGASYFRFLGRKQRYGLSARGLAVGAGAPGEEFPFFREFWIETPGPLAERVTIYALLDGASVTGAFRFDLYPGAETVLEVSATLFPRVAAFKLGLAPLTSMFFTSQNDRRFSDDFRPELHDSDGLLIHSGTGEWIWRPLRNPTEPEVSAFLDRKVQGFGLLQRDRVFEDYQDLDLGYELRPSYWIEPKGDWGDGRVELVELPTGDETNDNIVASWVPDAAVEAGQAGLGGLHGHGEPQPRAPVAGRAGDQDLPDPGARARLEGGGVAGLAPLHHRLLGRRPRLLRHRPVAGAGGADLDQRPHHPQLPGAEPAHQRLPGRHRRGTAARPEHGPAGLPEVGQQGPDGNLDVSLEGAELRAKRLFFLNSL